MSAKTERVHARISARTSQRLSWLAEQRFDTTLTAVIERAIDEMYEREYPGPRFALAMPEANESA